MMDIKPPNEGHWALIGAAGGIARYLQQWLHDLKLPPELRSPFDWARLLATSVSAVFFGYMSGLAASLFLIQHFRPEQSFDIALLSAGAGAYLGDKTAELILILLRNWRKP